MNDCYLGHVYSVVDHQLSPFFMKQQFFSCFHIRNVSVDQSRTRAGGRKVSRSPESFLAGEPSLISGCSLTA